MHEIAIYAFKNPMLLFMFILIVGAITLVLYLTANDRECGRVGGGIATLLFLPAIIVFICSLSAGVIVGTHCLKNAYKESKYAMDIQIQKTYAEELNGLSNLMYDHEITKILTPTEEKIYGVKDML